MRLTFPIGYDLKGRRPGKRVFRPYRYSELVSVDIPEVDASDAPIAVEWEPPRGQVGVYDDRDLGCHGETGTQFTRWYEGRHWLRLVEGHAAAIGTPQGHRELTPDMAQRCLSEGNGHAAIGLRRFPPGFYGHVSRVHEDPTSGFEEIRSSDRPAAMLAVGEVPRNLICVDGVLHAACAQPTVRMTASFGDDTHKLGGLWVDVREEIADGWLGFTRHHLSYALDSWDRLASRHGMKATTPPIVYVAESIDPDIDNRRAADRLVKKTAYEFGYPNELADELRAYFSDMDTGRVSSIAGLAEQYVATWNLDAREHAKIARAIERFEDRMSISVDVVGARAYGM